MRSVELAVFADALAAEAAALNARLERARSRLRHAAIEREARQALPEDAVNRLGRLGLLGGADETADAAELEAARLDIVAVQRLQCWVEAQLAALSSGSGRAPTETVRRRAAGEPEQPPRLGAAA